MRLIDADNIKMPKDASYKAAVKRIVAVQPEVNGLDVIVEALEKQIPHKPMKYNGLLDSVVGICNCKVCLYEKSDYCPNCGQRIDWGSEDEEME